MAFLNNAGLERLWGKITTKLNTKVDKVSGKGLSTNDYTTAEKNKLAGIATGATKVTVDSALSSSSTNPVQNKVINTAISNLNTLVGDTSVASQISGATNNCITGLSVSGKTVTYTKKDGSTGTITTQDTNTTYSNATTSVAGLMSKDDKAKLDAITASADAVSFSRSLTSGTKVGTITINGTGTDLYAPTNTDTHYTTGLKVGASNTATANAAASNGSVYLNVLDNTTVRDSHKITGSGATTVTSDANGVITISSTNTTYSTATSSANGLMSSSDKAKLDGIASGATKVTVDSALSSSSTNPVQNKVVNTEISRLKSLVGDTAVATQISNYASQKSHTHDDRYYTESEIDSKLSGKANSSHGTHVPSTCTTITDWNSATTNGWYMGSNISNQPVNNGGWFYGIVIVHNSNYIRQIAWHFATDSTVTGTNCDRFERVKHNGTWGSWVNTSVRISVPSNAKFTDTTYGVATTSTNGLMSSSDKTKLDGIATGANKTTVDSTLSTSSTNPIQNKVVTTEINGLKTLVGDTAVSTQISNAISSANTYTNTAIRKAAPRNLLDNSDFQNPVNQRGGTSYTGNDYSIDRWKGGSSNSALTVNDGYITITGSNYVQYIPGHKDGTFSAFAKNISGGLVQLDTGYDASLSARYVNIPVGSWAWAALYEGEYTAETLPEYQPKGYAAEFMECQRYLFKIADAGCDFAIPVGVSSSNRGDFDVPLPVEMRVPPSIFVYGGGMPRTVGVNSNAATSHVSRAIDLGLYVSTKQRVSVYIVTSGGAAINGLVSLTIDTLDCGAIFLSAEL